MLRKVIIEHHQQERDTFMMILPVMKKVIVKTTVWRRKNQTVKMNLIQSQARMIAIVTTFVYLK
eukprot:15348002-Ditylum_brightwellii.AAC.1